MQGSGPVATYLRVMEHAVKEADAREAALRHAVTEAAYLEDQAKQLLSASRADQVAMQRALLQQVHVMQSLERVRLQDATAAAAEHVKLMPAVCAETNV
jgi:hypothetical protein